jgi:DNA-binding NtrC family response regulator
MNPEKVPSKRNQQREHHVTTPCNNNLNCLAMNLFADAPSQLDTLTGKPRVLFLDNDESNLVSFRANFRKQFEIFTAISPFEAYNLIEDESIQVVLADHRMPSISGVDFLETVARDYPTVQRVLVTGDCDLNVMLEAINKGRVDGMLLKPFETSEISQVIGQAWNRFKEMLEKDIVVKQLRRQNQQFEFMLRQRLLS